MTSPGPSPPRSKKESSDASDSVGGPAGGLDEAVEPLAAGDVVVPSVPEPGIDQRRLRAEAKVATRRERERAKAAARTAARRQRQEAKAAKAAARAAAADAKREAEARARKERQEERQQEIAAEAQERAEASAARAAEAVDTRTAELQAPELAVEELDLLLVEDEVVDVVEEPAEPVLPEPVLPEPVQPEPASEAETRLAEAREAARRERAEARDVARREHEAAKEAARREREAARTAERVDEDDHIVEPPREPKVPLLERLRRGRGTDDETRQGRSPRVVVAAVVGAVGLICSVVLAVGAFMAALGTDEANGFYAKLSSVCDTLVGPLRDLFSFSGANADMKEALVAWGAGSLVYLGVFLASQAFLGSGDDD
ncbi:MAG: hypothetical protein ABWY50_06855 [Aeromicrobium sp.]